MAVVQPEPLIQLIEIELVNQYQRFLQRHLSKAPKNCRFNVLTQTPEGGYIRICKCPHINTTSQKLISTIEQYTDKPCVTLAHAKKCPIYQHYTGVASDKVVAALTDEFLVRLSNAEKRASSFKILHTLWLLLHETEVSQISRITRWKLKFIGILFHKKYLRYLIKHTPKADAEWARLATNFKYVLSLSK